MGMSKPLKNPDLPPGAIVETDPDGGAWRNDGVRLTPASQNPWYVLATVAGEQEGTVFDSEEGAYVLKVDEGLNAQNRRFWNGWMCQGLEDDEREELARKLQLSPKELLPLGVAEMKRLTTRFQKAFPDQKPEETIPNPELGIDFRQAYFPQAVVFGRFYLARPAIFFDTCFVGPAVFQAAYFDGLALFHNAHFNGPAYFDDVQFAEAVVFHFAQFEGPTFFQGVGFSKRTEFRSAGFTGFTDFSDGRFGARTSFDNACFKSEVP